MAYTNNQNYDIGLNNIISSSENNSNPIFLSGNNNIIENYYKIDGVEYPIQETTTGNNYITSDNNYLGNTNDTTYIQNIGSNNYGQPYNTNNYNSGIIGYDNLPYSSESNVSAQPYSKGTEGLAKQNKEVIYYGNNFQYDTNNVKYMNNEEVNKYFDQLLKDNKLDEYNNTNYIDYTNNNSLNNNNNNIYYNNKANYNNNYIKTNNNINNFGYTIANDNNKKTDYNRINNAKVVNNQVQVINKGVNVPPQNKALIYPSKNVPQNKPVIYPNKNVPQNKPVTYQNTGIQEIIPNQNKNQKPVVNAPITQNLSIVEILPEQNSPNNITNNQIQNKPLNNIYNNNIPNTNNNLNVTPNNQTATINQNNNTIENIQNKPPVKQRPLNNTDFINIVYKDIGMINLGNTCYINSCLQILIHCPLFIYKFFNLHSIIKIDETPISFHLFKICVVMMNTVNTQETCIDIEHFKNAFGMKHPIFQGYTQNDSQEFCRVLLEDISTELNEVKYKPLYKELTNSENKTKIIRDKEFDHNFKERENSIITDLFYSQIITTFTCQCKAETYSFQKLLDFPLLLPENENNIDIKILLKNYFQSENINFETECEKCKKIVEHKKEIKISHPPEILILSLQRIDEKTKKKNECIVTFPEVLDMKEFIDHECGFDKEPLYGLYAVINHLGNMECGHYFSYIKNLKTKEWHEFNDSIVKKIDNNIESFPYAYALFYIKKQNNASQ